MPVTIAKSRYKVNLPQTLADCDANYGRLLKLMPDWQTQDAWQYALHTGVERTPGPSKTVSVHILERCKYTTCLELDEHYPNAKPWLYPVHMEVRLYHDARTAEVIRLQGQRSLPSRHHYPNKQMFHLDEKAQHNRFLSDWLMSLLKHGQVLDTVGTF